MISNEEKKALERIEDFLTTNIIVSISNDETADSEELKAFISKNEYLAIEFIASIFLKQSKEIEELKEKIKTFKIEDENIYLQFGEITEKKRWQDKIKARIKEVKDGTYDGKIVLESLLEKE